MCKMNKKTIQQNHKEKMKKYILLFITASLVSILSACGGDDPDYESCSTISGKTYCCRTYCNDAGNKCNTKCD